MCRPLRFVDVDNVTSREPDTAVSNISRRPKSFRMLRTSFRITWCRYGDIHWATCRYSFTSCSSQHITSRWVLQTSMDASLEKKPLTNRLGSANSLTIYAPPEPIGGRIWLLGGLVVGAAIAWQQRTPFLLRIHIGWGSMRKCVMTARTKTICARSFIRSEVCVSVVLVFLAQMDLCVPGPSGGERFDK